MYQMSGSAAVARQRGTDRIAKGAESGVADALNNVSLFALCSKKELRLIAKLAKQRSVPARHDTDGRR